MGKKGFTLSSSEAEYVVMPEAVKEIIFIDYLLESIGISVIIPIVFRTDNIGALVMVENYSFGM